MSLPFDDVEPETAVNSALFSGLTRLSLPYLPFISLPPTTLPALRHLDVTVLLQVSPNSIAWLQALPSLATLGAATASTLNNDVWLAFLTALHTTLVSLSLPSFPLGPEAADTLMLCSKLTHITITPRALQNYRVLSPLTTLASLELVIPATSIAGLRRVPCFSTLTALSMTGGLEEELLEWHLPHLLHLSTTNQLSKPTPEWVALVLRKFTTLRSLQLNGLSPGNDVMLTEAVQEADRRGMEQLRLGSSRRLDVSSTLRWLKITE